MTQIVLYHNYNYHRDLELFIFKGVTKIFPWVIVLPLYICFTTFLKSAFKQCKTKQTIFVQKFNRNMIFKYNRFVGFNINILSGKVPFWKGKRLPIYLKKQVRLSSFFSHKSYSMMRIKAIENLEQCTLLSLNSLWADDLVIITYSNLWFVCIEVLIFCKKKIKVDLCSHVLFRIKEYNGKMHFF